MTDTERTAAAIEWLQAQGYTVIEGEFVPFKMWCSEVPCYAPKSECKPDERKVG